MAAFIRLDLFPSTVILPDGTIYGAARSIVTEDELHVYVDSSDGPTEAYMVRYNDFSGRNTLGYTVETDDGDISVQRQSGCGCGSRLRGFHPFRGVTHLPVS